MSILSGYGKYKRYILTGSDSYQLCSQWTNSNTVHFDDNKTAQTKLGAIDGITDSLTSTSSKIALSAKSGKNLQDQITELNTDLDTALKIITVNNNTTLSAREFSVSADIDVPTGYTALGILSWTTNYRISTITISSVWLGSDGVTAFISGYNSGSALAANIQFRVLLCKSRLL